LKFGLFASQNSRSSKSKISLTFTSAFIGQKLLQFQAFDSRQVPESLPFAG
jgi:hypothetical protein